MMECAAPTLREGEDDTFMWPYDQEWGNHRRLPQRRSTANTSSSRRIDMAAMISPAESKESIELPQEKYAEQCSDTLDESKDSDDDDNSGGGAICILSRPCLCTAAFVCFAILAVFTAGVGTAIAMTRSGETSSISAANSAEGTNVAGPDTGTTGDNSDGSNNPINTLSSPPDAPITPLPTTPMPSAAPSPRIEFDVDIDFGDFGGGGDFGSSGDGEGEDPQNGSDNGQNPDGENGNSGNDSGNGNPPDNGQNGDPQNPPDNGQDPNDQSNNNSGNGNGNPPDNGQNGDPQNPPPGSGQNGDPQNPPDNGQNGDPQNPPPGSGQNGDPQNPPDNGQNGDPQNPPDNGQNGNPQNPPDNGQNGNPQNPPDNGQNPDPPQAAAVFGNLPAASFDPIFVGVYYYPWHKNDFHNGQGYMRRDLNHVPELGEYDDSRPEIISEHLRMSRQANIGLWATSWWGPGSVEDISTIKILENDDIGDMKIALHYESMGRLGFDGAAVWNAETDVAHMCVHYFGHPNYYRVDGKPVIFVYLTRLLERLDRLAPFVFAVQDAAALCGEELFIIGDHVFETVPNPNDIFEASFYLDGITNYDFFGAVGRPPSYYGGKEGIDAYYRKQEEWKVIAQAHDCRYVPVVSPGYNDRGVRLVSDHPPLSRRISPTAAEGSSFGYQIEQARHLVDTGSLMMVNSFNEWHEDTQIEPVLGETTTLPAEITKGLEYVGYGDLYLDILRSGTLEGRTDMFDYDA